MQLPAVWFSSHSATDNQCGTASLVAAVSTMMTSLDPEPVGFFLPPGIRNLSVAIYYPFSRSWSSYCACRLDNLHQSRTRGLGLITGHSRGRCSLAWLGLCGIQRFRYQDMGKRGSLNMIFSGDRKTCLACQFDLPTACA